MCAEFSLTRFVWISRRFVAVVLCLVLRSERMSNDRMFVFVELLYVNDICIIILHREEAEDKREREVVQDSFWNSVRKTRQQTE